MIQSKKINAIVAIAVVFALIIVSVLVVIGYTTPWEKTQPAYATQVFGTDVISLEILADEADWQEMLDNAQSEQFIMADVIVNGTKFTNVGIRPKGNSSLSQVARSESDRYSFRLQFDEYVKDQTCFGLQSFVVNNMVGDYTYMKEYVSYDLMKEAGVETPYYAFADIKVNGEAWGLYLAVEMYNESYEQRVFGTTSGMLYNVKSMDMGDNDNAAAMPNGQNNGGGQIGRQRPPGNDMQAGNGDMEAPPAMDGGDNPFPGGAMGGGFGGGMDGRGNNGGSLAYVDDNTSSYGSIFNNVVGKGKESDYQRVITALKALSEGRDLETYFDVDQILRYLAAHTIVVNLDSYSSSMAQNYYIYECNGQLTILPWDYNLAWGGFQSGDAAAVINFPIDTPVSSVEMSARPLLEKLFTDTEYLTRYHAYLQALLDAYFTNGKFEEKINQLDMLIRSYVQNDATAFCTYEQYEQAISAFITLGNLRAQSVQGQLDGAIPSTTQGQSENPGALVLADGLSLSTLGSMGGGFGGRGGDQGNADTQNQDGQTAQNQGNPNGGFGGAMGDRTVMEQAMQIIQQADGTLDEETKATLLGLGLSEEQIERFAQMGNRFPGGNQGGFGGAPNEGQSVDNTGNAASNPTYLITIGALVFVLLLAAGLVAKMKRKY